MTDTQLILKAMEAMEQRIMEQFPKRAKPRKKANPAYSDVYSYAESRGRVDLAKKFFDYYTEDKEKAEQWKDGGDKPIYNWKNKFQYWEGRNPKEEQHRREIG